MHGHRRRPLLGAALVVGASRSAARNEVEKQAAREAEARLAADTRRREEEERAMRTQRAIDESIARQYAAVGKQPEPPIYYPGVQGASLANMKDVRYCRQCNSLCKLQDKFCSACGCIQATPGADQRIMQ
ncbi:hypothetical protein AUEXF2481DRAFT_516600 [Aureobasidium subglaciale EXF-2481]|uniref:Uncharacterized protein n=1 Tax=Aureobasidium subglaciale (strain EXF-2481) TaxID=1043005 RepID=A0A074XZU2_AURSE|nr:uncharacterized protein AUEXF2481DRAFT_516600 [Aureobasidium subglaciale EXF-2481]KAI5197923.1 hypothetical protein E4T38_07726 [Aureobasidium subglaciale]KAI5216768.1 hypothetical protein E4T40_07736 [Aureobasidium subglaciale]KAI5220051.1 hypothetical protein E4T41_07651 [Aureobasidium subglaciale]KAI5257893.1 hypothetical protein E4T46_07627 [Aureobasidium subglaciale]KEQ91068.1 hypothetical protein AUEXF2481DRAFT_516600 [Aureobasidium subglaciale EXF-2481]